MAVAEALLAEIVQGDPTVYEKIKGSEGTFRVADRKDLVEKVTGEVLKLRIEAEQSSSSSGGGDGSGDGDGDRDRDGDMGGGGGGDGGDD